MNKTNENDNNVDNKSFKWSSLSIFKLLVHCTIIYIYVLYHSVDSRPVAGGWRSGVEPKPAIPDTPGVNLDEPDFRFPTRMFEEVTATVLGKYG